MHDSTELANSIGEKIKEVTMLAEQSRDAVISGNQALQNNVNELLNIKWWDMDDELLDSCGTLFCDVKQLIKFCKDMKNE